MRNRALFYLRRFSATSAHLRRVLLRRALPEAAAHDIPPDEVAQSVDRIVARMVELGYVDDRAFAEARARGQLARGRSTRRIRADLAAKGVAGGVAVEVLEAAAAAGENDLVAALRFAKRRRLGPYRAAEERAEHAQRDGGRLARAGFPTSIVLRLLRCRSADALEAEAADREA